MRRGNLNEKVKIYRYVTKGTFDAYNWGLVENKQKFIGQIMTSKSPARSIEDVDATALSYAEVKMLATGDPRIKEKMDLDIQVAKLKMLKANHQAQQYETQDSIVKYYPQQIAQTQLMIDVLAGELPVLEAHPVKEDSFSMTIQDKVYTERKAAGEAIVAACKSMTDPEKPIELGEYRGFAMRLALRAGSFQVSLKHRMTYTAELSEDIVGNITRINNALERIPKNLEANKQRLATLHTQLETAKEEAGRPFPLEEELAVKAARLSQLNTELDNDGRGSAPSQEDGEAPGREDGDEPEAPAEKPSIRQALRKNAGRRHYEAAGGPGHRPLHQSVPGGKGNHQPEDGAARHHQSAGLSAGLSAEDGGGRVHCPAGYEERSGVSQAAALHLQQYQPDRPPVQRNPQPLRPGCGGFAEGLQPGLERSSRIAEEI